MTAQETKLRVYIDNKQFYSPESGNYLEVYFQFVGHTFKYYPAESGLQSEVAVIINLFQDGQRITGDAYRLNSPVMKDSIIDDFFDLKRFAVNPGNYTLSVEISDVNSTNKPINATLPIIIDDLSKGISASDIESIEYATLSKEENVFVKSGYSIIPRLSTFFPKEITSIPIYMEFYNSNELNDTLCAVKEYIINTENGREIFQFTNYFKQHTAEVLPILRNMDISELPTGKYALNYTLLSSNLAELSTQSFLFERSNDIDYSLLTDNIILDPSFQSSISSDSVSYFLESLIPIAKPAEIKNIITVLKKETEENQRKHIQAFWSQSTPNNPYEEWMKYKGQVLLVQELYGNNFQEGFETDRGRVYLQYGSPTTIVQREVSSTEYPYEIWQYNKIGQFSNRRFIFYNPDLVNNAYRLLHSDMLGELKNPAWPQILSSRNTNKGNVDNPNQNVQDHWGGNSFDLFRQY
jgi:GWxTD domain-containing protein